MSRAQLTSTVEQNTGGAVAPFVAGKNKIINGDFYVNQRNFSSTTTSSVYMFDRWTQYLADGTVTYSAQTFTPGTAPVAGYEGKNFIRCVTTGQTLTSAAALLIQNIEDVRTLAGQTATISFWAKAGSGTPKVAVEAYQSFGTGGSPSAAVSTPAGAVTLTTSWARYSVTVAIPSISGKTLGTNNDPTLALNLWTSAGTNFNTRASSIGIQTTTIDIWGVQIEAGSVATPFTTATGTLSGELAACQRYYYRNGGLGNSNGFLDGTVYAVSTTNFVVNARMPVTMRISPSFNYSGITIYDLVGSVSTALTSLSINQGNPNTPYLYGGVASGLSITKTYMLFANGANNWLEFSSEL